MKKVFAKKTRAVFFKKVAFVFLALGALLGGAAFLNVRAIDLAERKNDLARALTGKTGFTATFQGPLTWSFSLSKGFALYAQNVILESENAKSPKDFSAQLGAMHLRIAFWPLFHQELKIEALDIENADVRLRAEAWNVFKKQDTAAVSSNIALAIDSLTLSQSRLNLETAQGQSFACEQCFLFVENGNNGLVTRLRGLNNDGQAFSFSLFGSDARLIGHAKWPFSVQGLLGAVNVSLENAVLAKNKDAFEAENLVLSINDVTMNGPVLAKFNEKKPYLRAVLKSEHLDANALHAIFKTQSPQRTQEQDERLFSANPFDLSLLRALDARIDLAAQTLVFGETTLTQATTRLVLADGILTLIPLSALAGGKEIKGTLTLDASMAKTAQAALSLSGANISIGRWLGGIAAPLSGKTDFSARLTAKGESAHAMAKTLDGTIDVFLHAEKTEQSALGRLASDTLGFFVPGLGLLTDPGLSCLAARYRLEKGIMTTKGFLLDTALATIEGKGTIDFRDETIALRFRAKPKGASGAILPPVRIDGALRAPSIQADSSGAMQNLLENIVPTGRTQAEIPDVAPIASGDTNACALALEQAKKTDPTLSAASKPLLPSSNLLEGKIKKMGDFLLQTLEEQLPLQ